MSDPQDDIATSGSWQNLQPLPATFVELPLDIQLNDQQSSRLKQGFVPVMQEEKWFVYFENNVLYQHRSWTGICIDEVHFAADAGRLFATHARVNRDAEQYGETDDLADLERITSMVFGLANLPPGATSKAVDPFVEALTAATQPNYLGSPLVVSGVVSDYVNVLMRNWRAGYDHSTSLEMPENQEVALFNAAEILSGNNPEYMPTRWHSRDQLGSHLLKYLEIGEEDYGGVDLMNVAVCALMFIGSSIQDRLLQCDRLAPDAEVESHVGRLIDFSVSVFLGTNTVYFPGQHLSDMESENQEISLS